MAASRSAYRNKTKVVTSNVLKIDSHKRLNQYVREGNIASTMQTQVFTAKDQHTQSVVAIKSMKRSNPNRDRMQLLRRNNQKANRNGKKLMLSTEQSIRREIAILKACNHSHIVSLYEVIDDPSKDRIYLVMEYLPGGKVSWQDENTKEPLLTVDQSRRIFRDCVVALEYLEYLGIIHRDIKPDNMVWSSEDRTSVKLVDFGISHFCPRQRRVPFARWRKELESLNDPTLFPENDLLKLRGTVYFIAPEVVGVYEKGATPESSTTLESSPNVSVNEPLPRQRPPITKAIDVWALAVSLYCMLFGHFPFDIPYSQYSNANQDRFRLYNEICSKDWSVPETMGADKVPTSGRHSEDPKSVIRLLDRMLQKNPKMRATLYEVKRHPWVLEGIPDPDDWIRETSPAKFYRPAMLRWLCSLPRRFVKSLTPRTPRMPTRMPVDAHEMTRQA